MLKVNQEFKVGDFVDFPTQSTHGIVISVNMPWINVVVDREENHFNTDEIKVINTGRSDIKLANWYKTRPKF